ncbi:hypothetical protein PENTCL1PPCAC_6574, partial [Pristionchus entomophagus]
MRLSLFSPPIPSPVLSMPSMGMINPSEKLFDWDTFFLSLLLSLHQSRVTSSCLSLPPPSLNSFLNRILLLLGRKRERMTLRVCLFLLFSSPESREYPWKKSYLPLPRMQGDCSV